VRVKRAPDFKLRRGVSRRREGGRSSVCVLPDGRGGRFPLAFPGRAGHPSLDPCWAGRGACRSTVGGCYTLCVRQLIINADDLGLTVGVNHAILETHTNGVVSSATLMANGGAFTDAIAQAQSAPRLSVGCHVVLVDGTPILDGKQVSSLVAKRFPRDEFHSNVAVFGARAVFRSLDRDEVVSEIVAQVRKIRAAGIEVSHLDTHKHAHLFPPVLEAVVRAAKICGVPAIRNPFVPIQAMQWSCFADQPGLWKRWAQVHVLRSFGSHFGEKIKRAGLATPDGVIGVIETGLLDGSLLRRALASLPDGTWELVCHPGYDDADLRAIRTRLRESRDEERRLLTSVELREFLEKERIRVISYREFAESTL